MRTRLFNRDFVLLWQGQLVSQLGHQAFSLAMLYWLMESTGSASLMGLVMMASLLPGVLLAPFGGALADRYSRRGIIVLSDLARGLLVLGLAGVMAARPEATSGILGVLFAVALAGGVIHAVFLPAIHASIPDLVPPDKVAAGNSLNQFTLQGSMLVGQAVGGVLYRLLGPVVLFAIDGLSYLFSAFSEAWIRLPPPKERESLPLRETLAAYWRETREGVAYVWERQGMRTFLLVAAVINFLAMPVLVLLPFYVADQLDRGPAWYGFLLSAMGGGSLVGYLLAGASPVSPRRRPLWVLGALLSLAMAVMVTGFVVRPWVALVLFATVGVGTGLVNIFVLTLFQISTPGEMRGRVMGLVMALSGAAAPLGMALGGVLGDLTDKDVPRLYLVCGVLMAGVTLFAATRTRFRDFLRSEAA